MRILKSGCARTICRRHWHAVSYASEHALDKAQFLPSWQTYSEPDLDAPIEATPPQLFYRWPLEDIVLFIFSVSGCSHLFCDC